MKSCNCSYEKHCQFELKKCEDGEVLTFIRDFMTKGPYDCSKNIEVKRETFMNGYCWHFANLLKNNFKRGEIVYAFPFGHVCWKDNDGIIYDAEGISDSEAYYHIPENFCEKLQPLISEDFRRINNRHTNGTTKSEIISIMKHWCIENNIPYDETVERFLND